MPSPIRYDQHGEPQVLASAWLVAYAAQRSGIKGGSESSIRLGYLNLPQPDVFLFREGGSCEVDEDGYIDGPPELVVEISAPSADLDLGPKLELYRQRGVKEYLVLLTETRQVRWHILQPEGTYVLLEPEPGIQTFASREFPGLRLDTQAFFAGDYAGVLKG